jgi:hypothetical protein
MKQFKEIREKIGQMRPWKKGFDPSEEKQISKDKKLQKEIQKWVKMKGGDYGHKTITVKQAEKDLPYLLQHINTHFGNGKGGDVNDTQFNNVISFYYWSPEESVNEDTKPVPYWTWNNKKIGEGTMSSGIFDSDKKKAKDAARKFAMFLKQNKKVTIENDPENPKKDHKDLQAYTKELMNYIFDDRMLDDLDPSNKKTNGKKANDIVTKRLKELGVKIR